MVREILINSNKMFYISTLLGIITGYAAFQIDKLNIINIRYCTIIILLVLMIKYILLLKAYFNDKKFEILKRNLRSYMILNFLAWYFGTLIFLVNFSIM